MRFAVLCVALSLAPVSGRAQPIVEPAPPPVVQPVPPAVTIAAEPSPVVDPRDAAARGTLMTGVYLTAVTHGAAWTIAIALGPNDAAGWLLALPIAGPAIWGALWGCDSGEPHDRDGCRALVATGGGFWAALQLGGFITMLLGATSFPKATRHEVAIAPLVTPDARGLAVSGAF